MADLRTRAISRDRLTSLFPDRPDMVRAFEALFADVSVALPEAIGTSDGRIDAALAAAAEAQSDANAAMATATGAAATASSAQALGGTLAALQYLLVAPDPATPNARTLAVGAKLTMTDLAGALTVALGFVPAELDVSGNLALAAGAGFRIAESGAGAKQGIATLVAGAAVVNTTAVAANSRIFLTAQTTGGTPGALRVSARTAGASFTITSTSGSDTSAVAWHIFDPAP